MYLLDTDHLSILTRGGLAAQPLLARLSRIETFEIATTIVTYEEQTRGWLSYAARANSTDAQFVAYQDLQQHLENFCSISILQFDRLAILEYQRLRRIYSRLGTMDLKIAAIAVVNQAILLTRNLSDFGQIVELHSEDWTTQLEF